jgi:hypothetical protein
MTALLAAAANGHVGAQRFREREPTYGLRRGRRVAHC